MAEFQINDENKTKRLYELDLLKAMAVIGMIMCHPVYCLGEHIPGHEQDVRYFIADVFFGEYFAVAHAFMFAMGVCIVFSGKNKPADLIRRGIRLYVMGYLLNFFRYGIYAIADGLIEGQFHEDTVYSIVVLDIFHFAGMALIATGIFQWLKLKEIHIFFIGVILSVLGGFLAFTYCGTPVMNYLLGHFITTTEDESCFVFFNWYIFVAAGLLFGTILKKTEDTDRLYRRLLYASLPVMSVYIILTVVFGANFLTKNQWYYATSLPGSAGLLSIDLVLLSAFYFLLKKVDVSGLSVFITMSRNTTSIYWIHWCIIGFADSIFCYLIGMVFPYWALYLFSIILIPVSYVTAIKIGKLKQRKTAAPS